MNRLSHDVETLMFFAPCPMYTTLCLTRLGILILGLDFWDTPIGSGILIQIQSLILGPDFFLRLPVLKTHQIGIRIGAIWNSDIFSQRN